MYNAGERIKIFNLSELNPLLGRLGTILNNEINLEQGDNKLIVLLDETLYNDRAITISKYCLERINN